MRLALSSGAIPEVPFMKCFYFVKHHKFFVFALALSFCFTFIRPLSVSADDSLPGTFRFGYRSLNGTADYFETEQPLNLFQAISGGADQINSSWYNDTFFKNFIRSIGLESYFSNWDAYNPLFYCNLYCTSTLYTLIFCKSSCLDFDYSVTDLSDQVLVSTNSLFTAFCGSRTGGLFSLYFPRNFYLGGSGNFIPAAYGESFTSSFSSGGVTYPIYNVVNDTSNLSSAFSSFLSDTNSFFFTISFNASYVSYSLNVGGLKNSFEVVCSTFQVYQFVPENVYFSYSRDNGSFNECHFDLESDANIYDLIDVSDPYTYGLNFIPNGTGILTPTPIPSPQWVTPTPLPTVIPVPISLTPIPQYLDPHVPGAGDNIGGLNGYAGILDQVFSNFDIFALGSLILEYVYSFSGYFSFILIIPVICLIAFALGRLNQK